MASGQGLPAQNGGMGVATMPDEATTKGLLDNAQENLNTESLSNKFDFSRESLIEMALYLGIGFVVGFLLKKYSQFVLIVALIGASLLVLQHLGFLSLVVDWDKIQNALGFHLPATADGSLITAYLEWAKAHMRAVISFAIGFVVGIWVG